MSAPKYKGECLCGAVQFHFQAPVEVVNYCHCSRCRKRTGSAFATVVHAKLSTFEITSGEDHIEVFEPEGWNLRRFCGRCGSPLPGWNEEEDEVGIPAGLLEPGFNVTPSLHLMTAHKADWFEIKDDLPRYAEFPEDW